MPRRMRGKVCFLASGSSNDDWAVLKKCPRDWTGKMHVPLLLQVSFRIRNFEGATGEIANRKSRMPGHTAVVSSFSANKLKPSSLAASGRRIILIFG